MSDYISRGEAYKAIMGEHPDAHYPDWYASLIEAIPAADVLPVELIRERIHDALQLLDEINEECGLNRDEYRALRDTIEGIQLPDLETIMREYNTK